MSPAVACLGGTFCTMFDLWLPSGGAGIILIIPFDVLYLIAILIVWITHKSPARPYFASCVGIPGPFFASVGILFGLFAAFLANDAAQRRSPGGGVSRSRWYPSDSPSVGGAGPRRRTGQAGRSWLCAICAE